LIAVLLFLAILDMIGSLVHIVGSIILIIFAAPMNIINAIMDMNPILLNLIAFSILSCKLKKHAIENRITIITAIETKIERLGNSAGENEEIVNKIRNPPIIVALRLTMVLISRFLLN
jgi:hypothetical protein